MPRTARTATFIGAVLTATCAIAAVAVTSGHASETEPPRTLTLTATIDPASVQTTDVGAEGPSAGDVTGQGLGGIWWVVAPDGSKIASSSTSTSGGGYTK